MGLCVTYFDCLDLSSNEEAFVLDGLPQRYAFLHRHLLALVPDDSYHVEVAETDDERGYDEDVRRQEREVRLTLPPSRVAATQTLLLRLSVRVRAYCHLHSADSMTL